MPKRPDSIEICLAGELQMDVITRQLGGTLLSMDSTAQTGSWTLATAGLWQASWWLLTANGPVREPFHNGLSGYWTCRDKSPVRAVKLKSQGSRGGHCCSHQASTGWSDSPPFQRVTFSLCVASVLGSLGSGTEMDTSCDVSLLSLCI